jgi:hypothetical protein
MFPNLNILNKKIILDGAIWFGNDLSFIKNKNTSKQHQKKQKMGKKKQKNKMITNNLAWVSEKTH